MGRGRELAAARRDLAAGWPLLVTGDPGMGKSAFLDELARELAAERELPVCRVRVTDFAEGQSSTITPLRLLDVRGEVCADALARLIGEPPNQLRDAVVRTCRAVFLVDPAVVVVDGVPTGAATHSLLTALSETRSPLLMSPAGPGLPFDKRLAVCHLGPLSRADRQELIRETLAGPSPRQTLEAIERFAGGSPLLARLAGALPAAGSQHGPPRLRVPTGLSDEAGELLDDLAALGIEELPAELAPLLGSATALRELRRFELLHPTGEGDLRLHPLVRSLVVRDWSSAKLQARQTAVTRALFDAAHEHPGAFGDHPAAFVDLVSRSDTVGEFVGPLADQLAQRGRLAELLVLRQVRWARTGEVTLDAPLAVAARETGNPELAAELLTAHVADTTATHAADTTVILELAVTAHHMGRLTDAEGHLATLPSGRGADGWALLTRAAVHCDRGDLRAPGPLLRRAVEAHQVAGDRRGEAWTMFQYGRLCLLRGQAEDAEKLLYAAQEAFHAIGDVRGVAWAATELGRVSFPLGTPDPEALAMARRLHEHEGDRRGAAWAHLWWILAADQPGFPWHNEFSAVAHRFRTVSDRVGLAWALHHHGLALARAGGPDEEKRRAADRLLEKSLSLFETAGCPHGMAWTMLEHALRAPARRFLDADWSAEIRHMFRLVGDEAGEAWVDLAESAPDTAPPYELVRRYPAAVLDAVEWTEDGDLRIPRAARHTQPEPRPDSHDPAGRGPAGRGPDDRGPDATHAHVRLTLLDDAPAQDESARIALQVVPGARHRWSTAPLPALRARATPLTHAEVEPPHAVTVTVRGEGAEFRFTPHRPGHHRLRFTIEDPVTGAVLQQVETEIDVIPSSPGPRAAAPRPEPARRA
ncbi:tetratricopeptide repeat protein [Streptomyces sp. NPDC048275]|uniref:tetratricopeptide repeat protein n=1 Tax=Streptomyces sp. NPDC048275 TaxID=3155629 RepID=UPI003405E72A